MGDWPSALLAQPQIISSFDVGYAVGGQSSTAWPTANKAIYHPFRISFPMPVKKLWWFNGTNVTGNVDLGIYGWTGTKLISTGSTAGSGTSAIQEVDVTDFLLVPGQYYFGLTRSSVTGHIMGSAVSIPLCRTIGLVEEASALPLPAVATFATVTSAAIFLCGLSARVTF